MVKVEERFLVWIANDSESEERLGKIMGISLPAAFAATAS